MHNNDQSERWRAYIQWNYSNHMPIRTPDQIRRIAELERLEREAMARGHTQLAEVYRAERLRL